MRGSVTCMTHCLVGHLVFVLVCIEWIMCPTIDNLGTCEIRGFPLSSRCTSTVNYVDLQPKFNEWRNCKAECSGWRAKWSAGHLVQSVVNPKYLWKTALHSLRTFRVNLHKVHTLSPSRLSQVLHKRGSENAHVCARNVENVFGFDVLARYHKDGDEFRSPVARVTGDKTWVSFVNVETKEPTKQDIIIITPHMRTTAMLVLMTGN
jgi:hypothetical protein